MDIIAKRNELLGETAVKALKNKRFEAYFCQSKEETCAKVLSLIAEESTVTWGGSMSIFDCGIPDKLKQGNYTLIDRAMFKGIDKDDAMRRAFFADTYLMSANAISLTGELVNIDGNGNRVAAMCYGPKQVIVVAGINKITPDLDTALKRAKYEAAPLNAQRFDIETPCKKTGTCANCLSPDSICAQTVITRLCRPAGRIKIVLCGEPLGL